MPEALSNILIYGGSFILTLSLVVFVHEFGHFQAARWSKVAVETFSIGFGKTLASWKDRQGVQWRIAALPLGGYVRFAGDADPASTGSDVLIDTPERRAAARRAGFFHAMPLAVRAFVVAAGPLMNFVFAIIAFAALAMILGRDVTDRDALSPRVDAVVAGTAAAEAGIRPGDLIVSIDGVPIATFGEFRRKVEANAGARLLIGVERGGDRFDLTLTTRTETVTDPRTGIDRQVGRAGVHRVAGLDERVIEKVGPLQAIGYGAENTWNIVTATFAYVGNILTGQASAEHLSGPLGIMNQSGQIAESAIAQDPSVSWGDRVGDLLLSLLGWAAVLSVAVGIVNLLPIPVLDGGHLAFYAIEAVRGGKPLPMQAQEWATRGGLVALLALFLFATWNDIQRILVG